MKPYFNSRKTPNSLLSSSFVIASMLAVVLMAGCDTASNSDLASDGAASDGKKSRSFHFTYGATIEDLPAEANVRVWIPMAESNAQQSVRRGQDMLPTDLELTRDAKYQNPIGYFESTGKTQISFELNYDVTRQEAGLDGTEKTLDNEDAKKFLSANKLVPTDGAPLELLQHVDVPSDQAAAGKLLYELVENHMKYDKSQPGYGNGDSVWACDSKTGNCTDFHSLFISLARSQKIPAKFEIGFPIGADDNGTIGGYHCWAWFHVDGQGWMPVDISEADKHPEMKSFYFGNLTADRVAFSSGRDIELSPKSASEPLNYFVYPHVEVDGKVWPKEKIKLNFSYSTK